MEKIKIGSNIKLIYDLSELTENARKEIDTVKCYLSLQMALVSII